MHRNFIAAVQLARLCVFNEFVSSAAHRHGGVSSVTAMEQKPPLVLKYGTLHLLTPQTRLILKYLGGFLADTIQMPRPQTGDFVFLCAVGIIVIIFRLGKILANSLSDRKVSENVGT